MSVTNPSPIENCRRRPATPGVDTAGDRTASRDKETKAEPIYSKDQRHRYTRAAGTLLGEAIAEGRFQPYFQPQVSLGDGSVVGLEALARWCLDDGNVLAPAQFIPLAEETGLILPLGESMLRHVAWCVRDWNERGWGVPPVFVNCSARQLRAHDFIGQYRAAAANAMVESGTISLEITESVLVEDLSATRSTMVELNMLGARLSIDDFGTGFSSFGYLQQLPFQVLKIDRGFVSSVYRDAGCYSIIKALIQMARELDLYVIAEGIETVEQESAMRQLGCDAGQGFLYSHAMPAREIGAWLT